MKDNEGTIEQSGSKGKDAQTIATTTIPGAGIGAIADGGKGAGIGAGVGGVVGLATVLLTRGPDVQLGSGRFGRDGPGAHHRNRSRPGAEQDAC